MPAKTRVPQKIAITTGDADGIGLEIAIKALNKLGPQLQVHFLLFQSSKVKKPPALSSVWKQQVFSSAEEALTILPSSKESISIIKSSLLPPMWVEEIAHLCLQKKIFAMCTGPLSKTLIKECGLSDHGHTDILKRICNVSDVNMAFIGAQFNVLLVTDHVPLHKVASLWTATHIQAAFENALMLRQLLPSAQRKRPLAFVGLNPHAGEKGILGSEELDFQSMAAFKKEIAFLPPDVAFQKSNWKKYSVFLAAYHDQGLIPFKMIHGHSGVHMTVGIPFIRTSVDHGTAKDIFGQNKADPSSMLESLLLTVKLAKTAKKDLSYV